MQAYAVVDKGVDLKDHIHEWAGDSAALLSLVANMVVASGKSRSWPPIIQKQSRHGFMSLIVWVRMSSGLYGHGENFAAGKILRIYAGIFLCQGNRF